MIRNALEATSENIAIIITPMGRVIYQYRAKQLEAMHSVFSDINGVTLPHWIRLTRKGNQFISQHSSDGINWYAVQNDISEQTSSIKIPMDKTVHIGLSVMSNNSSCSTEAKMSNITVTGNVSPSEPFTMSEDINLHSITLQKKPKSGDQNCRKQKLGESDMTVPKWPYFYSQNLYNRCTTLQPVIYHYFKIPLS